LGGNLSQDAGEGRNEIWQEAGHAGTTWQLREVAAITSNNYGFSRLAIQAIDFDPPVC